jgi:hypothetical protein
MTIGIGGGVLQPLVHGCEEGRSSMGFCDKFLSAHISLASRLIVVAGVFRLGIDGLQAQGSLILADEEGVGQVGGRRCGGEVGRVACFSGATASKATQNHVIEEGSRCTEGQRR